MKYEIEHRIQWQYDRPVFIEPMTVRLRPRSDGSQRLFDWRLTVEPGPSGASDVLDAFGNAVSLVWFERQHDAMSVTAVSTVETLRDNPFDYFLVGDAAGKLPLEYEEPLAGWLAPYRQRGAVDRPIERWAGELAAAAGEPQAFLSNLAGTIYQDFEWAVRERGSAVAAAETLATRQGACRDFSVLFMEACRAVGIAARFVSGYAFDAERAGSDDLHAWAEVYLPGAGWRGYDPSLGLAVAEAHIPIAAAPDTDWAAPTSGTYRGTGAQSTMDFRIALRAIGNEVTESREG